MRNYEVYSILYLICMIVLCCVFSICKLSKRNQIHKKLYTVRNNEINGIVESQFHLEGQESVVLLVGDYHQVKHENEEAQDCHQ